jgi:hypothetical protein
MQSSRIAACKSAWQVDRDELGRPRGLLDAVPAHAGALAVERVGVEQLLPDVVVGQHVLDPQGGHPPLPLLAALGFPGSFPGPRR